MASNINSDNGVVSGSAGLKTSADSSGVLALQTNGTTAITVDTSQNVGIGATPNLGPSAPYNVLNIGTQGGGGIVSAGTDTYLTNNIYLSGNSFFAYSGSAYGSYYNQSGGNHTWKTSTATGTGGNVATLNTLLTLNSNGALALFGGASANGVGITFPATQSASSNANTLDDYEEGTWTPSLGGNATYSLVNGNYVKVGRLVYAVASINMSSIGSGSTTTITGLPFTNGASGECNVSVGYLTGSATSISSLTGYVSNGGTSIVLQSFAAGGGTSTAANGIFANSTQIRFQAVYYANT